MNKICPACWDSRTKFITDLWDNKRPPRVKWYPNVYFPRLGRIGFDISWIHSPQGHRGVGLSLSLGRGLLALHWGD